MTLGLFALAISSKETVIIEPFKTASEISFSAYIEISRMLLSLVKALPLKNLLFEVAYCPLTTASSFVVDDVPAIFFHLQYNI